MSNVPPDIGTVAFRLPPERLGARLAAFNQRREVTWFGFQGALDAPGDAIVRFARLNADVLGGGGTAAVNGGVIAAGFDAVCVLAAAAQFDVDVVVTVTLQVQFLRLARVSPGLEFRAHAIKSGRQLCFVQAVLTDRANGASRPMASAMATLAPIRSSCASGAARTG